MVYRGAFRWTVKEKAMPVANRPGA